VRTWKDFFIHIAAIAVGLLIAIGLEQTVEYFATLRHWSGYCGCPNAVIRLPR
jgi:hypothetical protein